MVLSKENIVSNKNEIDTELEYQDIIKIFKNHFCLAYESVPRKYVKKILDFIIDKMYSQKQIEVVYLQKNIFLFLENINTLLPTEKSRLKSVIKICFFKLHFSGIIDLSYKDIDFLTFGSNVLTLYMEKVCGCMIDKDKYKKLDLRFLIPLMFKNRIIDINSVTSDMLYEYLEYGEYAKRNNIETKYLPQYIKPLHVELFLKGIVDTQPVITNNQAITNDVYFKDLKECDLKNAILWYLKNAKVKITNLIKFKKYLNHFGIYMQNNYFGLPIEKYNKFIVDTYCNHLTEQLNSGEIPSRNWACNCITRINAFFNFLYQYDYPYHPIYRNLFMPNLFDERDNRYNSKRTAISEDIMIRLLEKAKAIGEKEWAKLKIYEGTGMRLNELTVFKVEDFHDDAKSLVKIDMKTNIDIRDDICWIKVTSPKIKNKERIILIDHETFEAFSILKKIREEKFGNIPPMINPKNPQLGKCNFLILNRFGLPYQSLSGVIGNILKKIDIKDEKGKLIKIVPHQFRHTYLTGLVACGCPIYMAMDFMGHVDPAMEKIYDHNVPNSQEIIYHDNLVSSAFNIKVELNSQSNNITGDDINSLHIINTKYQRRGGFCMQDEFQEDCKNIDCIECPIDEFKSNISFISELKESMLYYCTEFQKQEVKTTDRAIHLLYMSRLYEKLLTKVINEPSNYEVKLSREEKIKIAKEVGLV